MTLGRITLAVTGDLIPAFNELTHQDADGFGLQDT